MISTDFKQYLKLMLELSLKLKGQTVLYNLYDIKVINFIIIKYKRLHGVNITINLISSNCCLTSHANCDRNDIIDQIF
jgi:hypothetical protein